MRSFCLSLLFLAFLPLCASAETEAATIEPPQRTIVYVDGTKFYVHTVAAGETLYSISRSYDVAVETILAHNPSATDGLRCDETIKIPVPDSAAPKRKRKDFEYHTVAAGETLYSISRFYGISIDTVLEDNPQTDPANLSVGQRLYIRKSDVGSVRSSQVSREWEAYRDNLNAVAPDGYFYYIVQSGDTLYSLCRRFETSEEIVRSLNDLKDGLKAGALLMLPSKEDARKASQSVAGGAEDENGGAYDSEDNMFSFRRSSGFRAVDPHRALRVALLLPLTKNGAVNNNYMDFYRGFLLGAEAVRESGYSMELTLFDTEQNLSTVERIVDGGFDGMNPDLIVGPVYENMLAPVVAYAEENGVPVVSPLATLTSTASKVLFQLSPDGSHKYDKVAELFNGSREVTLIYGQTVDREFEKEILAMLEGKRFATHKYVYEHHGKAVHTGHGDLSELLRGNKNSVFVVMADNETEVDRIMAAIASADISLRTRERTAANFVVFGSSKWHRYGNLDSSVFFRNGLVSLSSYVARTENEKVRDFNDRYITDFDSMPSPYAYRGYDAAAIFGKAMFGDIEYGIAGKRYVPLQTGYSFERIDSSKTVNTEWMRSDYLDNFTIRVR